MGIYKARPLFNLGKICASPGAADLNIDLGAYLQGHVCGDWGNLEAGEQKANESALTCGGRILSCYTVSGIKLYVITEANRLSTTITIADEY